jgi:hypothetical protein
MAWSAPQASSAASEPTPTVPMIDSICATIWRAPTTPTLCAVVMAACARTASPWPCADSSIPL